MYCIDSRQEVRPVSEIPKQTRRVPTIDPSRPFCPVDTPSKLECPWGAVDVALLADFEKFRGCVDDSVARARQREEKGRRQAQLLTEKQRKRHKKGGTHDPTTPEAQPARKTSESFGSWPSGVSASGER